MKITHEKMILIFALTLGMSAAANGAVLYNNIPASSQYLDGLALFDQGFIASQFSTNSQNCLAGCRLGNITLNLFSDFSMNPDGITNGFQLQVFSDIGNTLGTALLGMNNPETFSTTANNHVFTPDGTLNLNFNTNYWVKLSPSLSSSGQESATWSTSQIAIQTAANQPAQFLFESFPGTYTAFTNPKLLMKVEAIASNIVQNPIPGAVWLMGSGLLGLAASWRRKVE
jgi:hypothetical protein